jgi:hypothetical protein
MRVVGLVAHHSGARFEAAERGLSEELSRYALEDSPVMDALVTADLTTGPGGERLTYDERMEEILSRYAPDHPVHRAWLKARSIHAPAALGVKVPSTGNKYPVAPATVRDALAKRATADLDADE